MTNDFELNQILTQLKVTQESPKENCRGYIQKDRQKVNFRM